MIGAGEEVGVVADLHRKMHFDIFQRDKCPASKIVIVSEDLSRRRIRAEDLL